MNIALFGGSFDPPHLAHVQVVEYLLKKKCYDEIWVIPSRQNPLKEKGRPFEKRLELCRLAFGDLGERVKVLDVEKNLSGYTIDLIRHIKKENPQVQMTFIAGSELKDQISRWHEAEKLKQWIDFEFLPRPPHRGSPFLPLSSTDVRANLARGGDPRRFLPEKVAALVEKEGLYRT